MKNLQTIALCLLVLFMSCDIDDSPSNNNPNPGPDPTAFAQNFGSEIQRNFLGKIIDNDHNPIQGVTITIGSATAQTDVNGIFIINNATVHQRFGYVKAEKAGYIHGSRSVVPSSGTNKVTIMLLEENVVGTTNSGTTETIALPNGASVVLQGDYKKEDGSAYTGSVNVIMHHLDPADDDMKDQMPGMLYAANAQNEERMLQTFGMLAVELKGSGGETLNLADGSYAEIKMPLDASLMANAPSTIPLWHFDETHGYWIEDGQATLVGNAYVGTVTHFSFWNCDIPAEAIVLSLRISDENGNLLNNLLANITSDVYGIRSGYTNSSGHVCGFVPKSETLTLDIYYPNICNYTNIYNGIIGPFTNDTSIDITVLDTPELISESVIGYFNTCDGTPVTNGYVAIKNGEDNSFDIVDDGNFELSIIRCNLNNTFKLKAYDFMNIQETDSINFTFTTPITNVGTIASCNNVEEFITYQVDGNPTITQYFGIEGGMDGPYYLNFHYYSTQPGTNNLFNLSIGVQSSPIAIGAYTIPDVLLTFQDDNNSTSPNGTQVDITVNVSSIGNIGEYVDMNFSGTYLDNDSITHTISGTVHALRDY